MYRYRTHKEVGDITWPKDTAKGLGSRTGRSGYQGSSGATAKAGTGAVVRQGSRTAAGARQGPGRGPTPRIVVFSSRPAAMMSRV